MENVISPFLINPASWYLDKVRRLFKSIIGISKNDEYRLELYDYVDYSYEKIYNILTN